MALDFSTAVKLFMGTEEELAAALGLAVGDFRAAKATPKFVSPELTKKMATILIERGKGMARVGEMLLE